MSGEKIVQLNEEVIKEADPKGIGAAAQKKP